MGEEFDYWQMAQEAEDEVERVWTALAVRKQSVAVGAAEALKKQNDIRHLEIILMEQRCNVRTFLRRAVQRRQVSDRDLLLFAARIRRGRP
mgnify:CR=1 FL=1